MANPSTHGDSHIAKAGAIVCVVVLLGIAIALVVLGARGDLGGDSGSGASSAATTGAKCGGPYVGLSTEAAIRKAEKADAPWRIGREDSRQFPMTLDFDPTRVTFEIDNGTVTSAICG